MQALKIIVRIAPIIFLIHLCSIINCSFRKNDQKKREYRELLELLLRICW